MLKGCGVIYPHFLGTSGILCMYVCMFFLSHWHKMKLLFFHQLLVQNSTFIYFISLPAQS